jgi:hypothetical protein
MTEDRARTIANVVVATAGVAAAFVVLRTPSLRRLAFQAVRVWLGASVPAYLLTETRRAWEQSRGAA